MNRVYLIGNLTRDPELAVTNSGVSVCRFGLAVQRRFAGTDGEREADFFNIVVWRQAGENCNKYLKKGSKCAVAGSIQVRQYDGNDGLKHTSVEITADEVEFLNSKPADAGVEGKQPEKKEVSELQPIDDDNLPF